MKRRRRAPVPHPRLNIRLRPGPCVCGRETDDVYELRCEDPTCILAAMICCHHCAMGPARTVLNMRETWRPTP